MLSILEKQAPAKQNATSTITTLGSRLQNATLLEDRRAAILGLRSFAKLYPASVASGGLRSLIKCLNEDVEDVDTTKVILETLLMLFNPEETSPEASDDIALWLADEFTQRQENITALLDLLGAPDFYSRLYSLQLIAAISSARPERTQDCVYTAPLGVSRLVAVLEDRREAIRSGKEPLESLTPTSQDLQKLVAFENVFDRVFSIIDGEGGLTNGGITVQDCLSLLANLLRLNVSNQSYFRETGGVKKLAGLLNDAIKEQDSEAGVGDFLRSQRDKNMWGVLAVLRLFLLKGSLGTQANQISFWKNGIMIQVLDIGFRPSFDVQIRAEALVTASDLIRLNRGLQEAFGQHEVHNAQNKDSQQVNGDAAKRPDPEPTINVISGLLDLTLGPSKSQNFEVRLAACECLQAYFSGHTQIKQFFLRRAIDGFFAEKQELDNVLSILIQGPDSSMNSDPYRTWFSSTILFHLLFEDPEAKALAREVSDGNAEAGEEVITCIQSLSANVVANERSRHDERISIGILMILSGWLYEDHEAVDDFLSEGSNVQSVVQLVSRNDQSHNLVSGMCAFLLGIVYEFSTKDSPITRETLHSILMTRLGREQYVDKITKLREHPLLRDFEVMHRGLSVHSGGLPDVFFDRSFVDFLKDNFSRVLRAIDKAPGLEVPVMANGIQKGISRELVDTLKSQVEAGGQTIQKLESDILTLERKLGQEQADHRKAKESANVEMVRIRNINDALQRNHEEDLKQQSRENDNKLKEARVLHERAVRSLQSDMDQARLDSDAAAERARARNEAEIADQKATIARLRIELEKASKEHVQDLQIAHEDYTVKITDLETRLQRAEDKVEETDDRNKRLQNELEQKEEARRIAQTELDDMLMVLGDLEEKRSRDKARLKELNQAISDDEAEEDDDEVDKDGERDEDDVD